jgi:hypothetical protein
LRPSSENSRHRRNLQHGAEHSRLHHHRFLDHAIQRDAPPVPAWLASAPTTLDTTSYGTNVILRWGPDLAPTLYSYQVFRDSGSSPISRTPLRSAYYIDTNPPAGNHTYTLRAVSASGVQSSASPAQTVKVP